MIKHTFLFTLRSLLPLTCLIAFAPLFQGCNRSSKNPHYTIGVSQCSDDAWRQNMNNELQRELLFHPEIDLIICQADANSQRQCEQIDSLVGVGIDLLIVCPNEGVAVEPAVTRAYRTGLPVIVADRAVPGHEYTSFIGGDNYEVGQLLAKYIRDNSPELSNLDGDSNTKILEVGGLRGSTPAVLRHKGMLEGLDGFSYELTSVEGFWFEPDAYRVVDSILTIIGPVDIIVAHNDLMARGAKRAYQEHFPDLPVNIIGVDALRGEGNGLEAVYKGVITASVTYYSGGDLILETAANILGHQPFVHDTVFEPFLVTSENARTLYRYEQSLEHEVSIVKMMQERVAGLQSIIQLRQKYIYVLAAFIVLLIGFVFLSGYIARYRYIVKQEAKAAARKMAEQKRRMNEMANKLAKVEKKDSLDDAFIKKLHIEMEKHLSDPSLSIETLSDIMGMSRSQLYRKTKQLVGESPNDMIRIFRLKRARQLLTETDQTIQQVAYEVGFSSPSYFTKCYKEYFGEKPSKN